MKAGCRVRPAAVLLFFFLAPGLFAQRTYSWDELRERFRQTNPTLLADQIGIDESRAAEITAFLRPNPTLSVLLDQWTVFPTPNTAYQPVYDVLESGALSYLYERQHKRDLRKESAQRATEISVSAHADLERTLLFSLRTAFVGLLQAKAVLKVAQENLDYYDNVIKISRDRFQAGDLAKVDLARIELQRTQFQADLISAQVAVRTSKIALLTLLNDRTPVDQFDISGVFDYRDGLASLSEYRQQATDSRPDLRAAIQAIEKARTDNRLAVANGTADPTFGGDIGRNPPLPSYIGFSLTVPLRIFDKNQGEKLRTRLEIDRTQRIRQAAEAQVLSDVDSAYATIESTLTLLRPYRQQYLAQATEVRDIVTFSYQHGAASLLDFLDAQKEYRDTQLTYLNLIGSYLTAASQLNLAVGREVIL